MNYYKGRSKLVALLNQWESTAKSPDIQGRIGSDWTHGVIYGLQQSIKELEKFYLETKQPRGFNNFRPDDLK